MKQLEQSLPSWQTSFPTHKVNRRRHKKRAKKRRKTLPPLPSKIALTDTASMSVTVPPKQVKRKRKKRSKKQNIQPTEPNLSLLGTRINNKNLDPHISPERQKASPSPVLSKQISETPHETTPGQKHSFPLLQHYVSSSESPAPPEKKAISLKLLFRNTGDVTRTPIEQLDEFIINPLLPAEPI